MGPCSRRPDVGADAQVAAAAVGSERIHRADASNQSACDTSGGVGREDPPTPARGAEYGVETRVVVPRRPSRARPRASRWAPSTSRTRVSSRRRRRRRRRLRHRRYPVQTLHLQPCVHPVVFCPSFASGFPLVTGAPIDHRVADDFAARAGGGAREPCDVNATLAARANQPRRRRGR